MSFNESAWLLNDLGHVTEHVLVRLDLCRHGKRRGIYPIYRCPDSNAERQFGLLHAGTKPEDVEFLFPSVPIVFLEEGTASGGGGCDDSEDSPDIDEIAT